MKPRDELLQNLKDINNIDQSNVDATFGILVDASASAKMKSIAGKHAQRVFEELLKKPVDFKTWHLIIRDLHSLLTLYKDNIVRDSDSALDAKTLHISSFIKANGTPTLEPNTFDDMVHVFKKPALSYAYFVPECASYLITKDVEPDQFDQQYILKAFSRTAHFLKLSEKQFDAIQKIFHTAKQNINGLSTDEIQAEAKKFIEEMKMLREITSRISTKDKYNLLSNTIHNDVFNWNQILYLARTGADPNLRTVDQDSNYIFGGLGLNDLLVRQLKNGKPFPKEVIELIKYSLDPNIVYTGQDVPLKVALAKGFKEESKMLLQYGAKPDLAGDIAFDFLVKWLLELEKDISPLTPIMIMNIKDYKIELLAAIKRMDNPDQMTALKLIFENENSAFAKVCLAGHIDIDFKKGKTKKLHEYYLERCMGQKKLSFTESISSVSSSIFSFTSKPAEKPNDILSKMDEEKGDKKENDDVEEAKKPDSKAEDFYKKL